MAVCSNFTVNLIIPWSPNWWVSRQLSIQGTGYRWYFKANCSVLVQDVCQICANDLLRGKKFVKIIQALIAGFVFHIKYSLQIYQDRIELDFAFVKKGQPEDQCFVVNTR